MPTLLSIDVSPRGDRSISRALSKRFIEHWQRTHPDGAIIRRDLSDPKIPYMDNDWISGVYAPPEIERTPAMKGALKLSSELISEVQAADCSLISTPMYNFTLPAVLKSWIDYIVRPGFTFKLAPGWPGMLVNKAAKIIVVSRDVYTEGTPSDEGDGVTPVLRQVLSFMGITEVAAMRAGGSLGVNRGDVKMEDHLAKFEQAVEQLASQ
jgi:FMN-dependent NADH-azoreductase